MYVYSCNALSARFFDVDMALNFYFMIMIKYCTSVMTDTEWTGARFSKNLMTNVRKTYEKVWLTKNFGWACDYQKILQKSYEKRRTKLCKTYEKLTTTLQVSYESVKFAASDIILETLYQRLLLIEYFELKITDNQSDDFLRMLSKNDLPFSYENLRKLYLADLQKTYEDLRPNLGKILRKSYEVSKIRPQVYRH